MNRSRAQVTIGRIKRCLNGTTNRDNTLARSAVDLQNDFRARIDWCTKDFAAANHAPRLVVNGHPGNGILHAAIPPSAPGSVVPPTANELSARGSSDADGGPLEYEWWVYPEAGTYPVRGAMLENATSPVATVHIPPDLGAREVHVLVTVRDHGTPPLARYRRVIITGAHPKRTRNSSGAGRSSSVSSATFATCCLILST